MPSRPECRSRHASAALALAAVLAAMPLPAAAPDSGQIPSEAQIATAVQRLKDDPNLGGQHKERTLRWVKGEQPKSGHRAAWIQWFRGLFDWLARTSRFLVWGAVVVLVGFMGIFLLRLLRERGAPRAGERFTPPSHVRDLDIRPESLPDDIGAAARRLWQSGQQRAALALLYRGLISRLVHVYAVPIRGSSTEGECLALAASRLAEGPRKYASHLVRTWQQSVYGGRDPQTDTVFALCDQFAAALLPPAPAAPDAAA